MTDINHRRRRLREEQMRRALVDYHCGYRGCTRVAKQPRPAPPCPSHPHVRMKPGPKPQANRR